jgi:hypothetical protein
MRFLPLTVTIGALLVACTTTRHSDPTADREPAADTGRISFKQEFASARALNIIGAQRDFKKREATKARVLLKWAAVNPREVKAELDRLVQTEGSIDIGRIDLASKNKTAPAVLVANYNDARAVLHSPEFVDDTPGSLSPDSSKKLASHTSSELKNIEANVGTIAKALVDDAYQGVNLDGRAFARLDVVEQVGRELPHVVNKRHLGLKLPDYASIANWARTWRDALEFNFDGDPEVVARARALLSDKNVNQAAFANGLTAKEYLNGISQVEVTQTAIAHVMDVFLTDKRVLQAARIAASKQDQSDLVALIREALRLKPVKHAEVRIAKNDVRLPSGKTVKAGEAAVVLISVANRDAEQFEHANLFSVANGAGLGDVVLENNDASRVQLAETKAAVAALVTRPALRRVEGDAGEIDRRNLTKGHLLKDDEFRRSFPERFAVEWDISAVSNEVQIPSPRYAYDAYLNDFDRHDYRLCMSSQLPEKFSKSDVVRAIFTGLEIKKFNQLTMDNRDHFFCRLGEKFRQCMLAEEQSKNFNHLAVSAAHKTAYQVCEKHYPLTKTERAFYDAVMLGGKLRTEDLESRQAVRNSGEDYKFEDHIVFYDRFRERASMMNPAGQLKVSDRDILFYVRLNIDFRVCMGMPVIKHDVAAKVGIEAGATREAQYEVCKNGVWSQDSLRYEGKLSREEKYFYETIMLGRKLSFKDIK